MEDAVGDGGANLGVGPRGMALAEACGKQFAHRAVHAERLPETVLRRHGPIDRHLPLVGCAEVVGLSGVGHGGDSDGKCFALRVVSTLSLVPRAAAKAF